MTLCRKSPDDIVQRRAYVRGRILGKNWSRRQQLFVYANNVTTLNFEYNKLKIMKEGNIISSFVLYINIIFKNLSVSLQWYTLFVSLLFLIEPICLKNVNQKGQCEAQCSLPLSTRCHSVPTATQCPLPLSAHCHLVPTATGIHLGF